MSAITKTEALAIARASGMTSFDCAACEQKLFNFALAIAAIERERCAKIAEETCRAEGINCAKRIRKLNETLPEAGQFAA